MARLQQVHRSDAELKWGVERVQGLPGLTCMEPAPHREGWSGRAGDLPETVPHHTLGPPGGMGRALEMSQKLLRRGWGWTGGAMEEGALEAELRQRSGLRALSQEQE